MDKNGGLIHLYTGDGKGKTTAAIGLAVRARGAGKRVAFFQFMKGSPSGEVAMLGSLGVDVTRAGQKSNFVFQMNADEKAAYKQVQRDLFRQAVAVADGYDLLVLDEIASAVNTGIVDEESVLLFLDEKPSELEVVLTGRDPTAGLMRRARYISEVRCVRHPYADGVAARKGIEF